MSRRAFAERVGTTPALVFAFAAVPREAFLPPPPWLAGTTPFVYEPVDDVYQDAVFAIDPTRQLNNGVPSAHARWLAALGLVAGERVLHLGCGLGYYTAIVAELVGATGQVLALDVDADLAARASANLAAWTQASARHGDGGAIDTTFDALYVNAGATHVPRSWQHALRPGGRIMMPLTSVSPHAPDNGLGTMLRIDRGTSSRWPITAIGPAGFYHCANARDLSLDEAIRQLHAQRLDGLVLETAAHPRTNACLVHHVDGCLQR
jgi:protein-L-isoaspartate(D-aspartate) O-methyltransferase|nr:methyltransferase domain-containing protein [Kofleriaceae bacterium]